MITLSVYGAVFTLSFVERCQKFWTRGKATMHDTNESECNKVKTKPRNPDKDLIASIL